MPTALNKLIERAICAKPDGLAAVTEIFRRYQHNPKPVVDVAAKLLESRRVKARHVGAWVLGEIGFPRKPLLNRRISLLNSAASQDRSVNVQVRAILSLGQIGGSSAAKVLRERSTSRRAVIRLAVAQALHTDSTPQTLTILERLSKDASSPVREWAAFQLGWQAFPSPVLRNRACRALCARLADIRREVRLEAIRALLFCNQNVALRQLKRELRRHPAGRKFFDQWHADTMRACDKHRFDAALTGCFQEVILGLDPAV